MQLPTNLPPRLLLLAAILIFLGLLFKNAEKWINSLKSKKNQQIDLTCYRQKNYLLTKAEKSHFHFLNSIIPNNYLLLTQINLDKLVYIKNSGDKYFALRNKINRKSIDFLVVTKNHLHPVLAIELDDSSHQKSSRRKRDQFVNRLFEKINLPLLRITTKDSQKTINSKISQIFADFPRVE